MKALVMVPPILNRSTSPSKKKKDVCTQFTSFASTKVQILTPEDTYIRMYTCIHTYIHMYIYICICIQMRFWIAPHRRLKTSDLIVSICTFVLVKQVNWAPEEVWLSWHPENSWTSPHECEGFSSSCQRFNQTKGRSNPVPESHQSIMHVSS